MQDPSPTAARVTASIRELPDVDFTEAAVAGLIATLSQRIKSSNWSHQHHAIAACESLAWAFEHIDDAAEAIKAEGEAADEEEAAAGVR